MVTLNDVTPVKIYSSCGGFLISHGLHKHWICAICNSCCCITLQKKKAEGPTDPQQAAKRRPPAEAIPPVAMEMEMGKSQDPMVLKQRIDTQGTVVRELKSSGAEKVCLSVCVCVSVCVCLSVCLSV